MARSLVICSDPEELARETAHSMLDAIDRAVRERGVARVALSGGSTPAGAYRALGSSRADLSRTHWFWVDERAVLPENARSNYALVKAALLEPARVQTENVFRMQADAPDLTVAAQSYETAIAREFGFSVERARTLDEAGHCPVRFDVLIAGIGADGHTASLFPGTGAVRRTDALVTAVIPNTDLEPRLSLTRPVLVSARAIFILASGPEKRPVVEQARVPGDEEQVPARVYLAAERAAVTWFVCNLGDPPITA